MKKILLGLLILSSIGNTEILRLKLPLEQKGTQIVGVVDGDTVKGIFGRKIKLAYVEAPEIEENDRLKRQLRICGGKVSVERMLEAGKIAKEMHYLLIGDGRDRDLVYTSIGDDNYGVRVADIKLHEVYSMGKDLVKLGYAVPYYRYMTPEMKIEYRKLNEYAKNRGRGFYDNYRPHGEDYRDVMECLDMANRIESEDVDFLTETKIPIVEYNIDDENAVYSKEVVYTIMPNK